MRRWRDWLTASKSAPDRAACAAAPRGLLLEELEARVLLSADLQAPLHFVGFEPSPRAAAHWQDLHEHVQPHARIGSAMSAASGGPIINAPAAGITPQGTAGVFSTANGNPITVSDAALGSGNVQVTLGVADFQQGFESGNVGFNLSGVEPGVFSAQNDATVAPSGTYGITARSGANFALAAQNSLSAGGSAFTAFAPSRAAGYSTVFPAGGFTTSVDIYLDPNGNFANGTQFDYTVAISGTTLGSNGLPVARRDFVFNVGFYNNSDFTGTGNRFVIAASNNAGPAPFTPAGNPLTVTTAGWYTFEHRFYDGGNGVLAVQLTLKDAAGNVLDSWTRSDPTDIIGSTVGGPRYGWFALQQFPWLAFDNVTKTSSVSGTLTLGGTAGLSFSRGSGAADSLMTFTGTLASVNAALNGLVYQPAAGYTGAATLLIAANDLGNGGSAAAQEALGSVPISVVMPAAPVIVTGGAAPSYERNAAATALFSALTVSDAESFNLVGATISLTGNYARGQDALGFPDQNGISGSWDPSTGVLTLSGRATVANYQTALRSVTYVNTSTNPSTLPRAVSISVNDGSLQSATATVGVTVVAPPIANPDGFSTISGTPVMIAQTALTANDVNFDGGALAIVSITHPGHGTLQTDPNGGYTYVPAPGFFGRDTFTYVVEDPHGLTATATVTVVVIHELPVPPAGKAAAGGPGVAPPDSIATASIGRIAASAAPTDAFTARLGVAPPAGPTINASSDQAPQTVGYRAAPARGFGDPEDYSANPPSVLAKSFFDSLPDRRTFLQANGAHAGERQSAFTSMWSALDKFRRDFDESTSVDGPRQRVVAQIVAGGGLALSAGMVSWMLRSGALAASLLAGLPSWTLFDPIPILAARRRSDDRPKTPVEPLDEATERAIATVFRSPDESRRTGGEE